MGKVFPLKCCLPPTIEWNLKQPAIYLYIYILNVMLKFKYANNRRALPFSNLFSKKKKKRIYKYIDVPFSGIPRKAITPSSAIRGK